jgi:hypothetical protein
MASRFAKLPELLGDGASDSAGPEGEILHSAKDVAGEEDKIADQQHYESAVNMRNCDIGVMDDHGGQGHQDRDNEGYNFR